jgi:hypothetical protein
VAATVNSTPSTAGHQAFSPYGKMCCTQPTGDSQDSQDSVPLPSAEMSPATRSTYAAPSAMTAMPRALRALPVSWAVTAAIAANSQPDRANSTPSHTEPATGWPWATMTAVLMAPSTRVAAAVVISAAANGACRPMAAAPTSSVRPCSSSVRVCRMTVSSANRPIITGTNPARQVTSSATLVPCSGPYSATNPALRALSSAYCTRSASVGKRVSKLAM